MVALNRWKETKWLPCTDEIKLNGYSEQIKKKRLLWTDENKLNGNGTVALNWQKLT